MVDSTDPSPSPAITPARPSKPDKDAPAESGGGVQGILLVALAIALIVGVYAFATMRRPDEGGRELPTAAILVEVERFDSATRAQIAAMEQAFAATGIFDVLGPSSVKYLLPPETVGDRPLVRTFTALTDDEWTTALRYMPVGDWLVPRLFRLDGTACVIRLGAKGGSHDFAPDAASRIESILDTYRPSFKGLRAYSRNAKVGGPAERDAINVNFGVQTAWAILTRTAGGDADVTWRNVDGTRSLDAVKQPIRLNPRMRTITTAANWARYYIAVSHKVSHEADIPQDEKVVTEAFDFAHANGIHPMLSQDGMKALIEVTTDAEGRENAEQYYFLSASIQDSLKGARVVTYRPRIATELSPEAPVKSPKTPGRGR